MRVPCCFSWTLLLSWVIGVMPARGQDAIPRPEHPTPLAVRANWANLNGAWSFRFDQRDLGVKEKWFEPAAAGFDRTITVPFPWESRLSGIGETKAEAKIGWYRRSFRVPASFPAKERVWLRFGAVDWEAEVWVNGKSVAKHAGGYTPFAVDITEAIDRGAENVVVVRAFDPTDRSLPTGKQIGWYTTTSGIWQTVWLESRPRVAIPRWAVVTTLDTVTFQFRGEDFALADARAGEYRLALRIPEVSAEQDLALIVFTEGAEARGQVSMGFQFPNPIVWTPEAPKLYDAVLTLTAPDGTVDRVETYFGLRTIARGKYGSEPFERILLNGKPVYLRTALDQSFNPEGIYTGPSDAFLRNDIILAKRMGLNGLRIHIKSEEPRRLYWADKLGLLILQDMPNTWNQNAQAREAWEATMREAVIRDRNHPSIIAWVAFNETWGLAHPEYARNKDTQAWVKRMVGAIRELDPTRLVEDNSPCNYDHVGGTTDLNSWHFYIDEHEEAERHVKEVVEKSVPGSTFNHCPDEAMNSAPLINSEYGGVSAGGGDRDISWSFRDLTTKLRKHNKIQGYVYTELTDIEWEHNGFANYDRSLKETGYGGFLPDMQVFELQQPDFVGYDGPPVIVAKPGETIKVPVFISHYSDREEAPLLRYWLDGWDEDADRLMVVTPRNVPTKWEKYQVTWQEPIEVKLPERPFVGALLLTLRDPKKPIERFAVNFVNIVVKPETPRPRVERRTDNVAILRFRPEDFSDSKWGEPARVLSSKVSGYGKGYFEYTIRVPEAIVRARPTFGMLRFEASAKAKRERVDWPERVNRQDYPQTDGKSWPTTIQISVNGHVLGRDALANDWADARGVLSHMAGVDHGSYGELIETGGDLPESILADLRAGKPLVIRIAVPADAPRAGGLAIYGAGMGQFPFDPTIEFTTQDPLPQDLGHAADSPVVVNSLAARTEVLVHAGDPRPEEATTWSYTTERPGDGWSGLEFDASAWPRGRGGFGTRRTPGVRVSTRWESPDIWMRTEVNLDEHDGDDPLVLRLFHDEAVNVFVNGKPLFAADGYVTSYFEVPLDLAQRGLFRTGRNVIAVHCRQTSGGQGVDVELKRVRAKAP